MSSYIGVNSRQDLELEQYFGKIKATCARKIIVTLFDLIYICTVNLPIFVMFAYFEPKEGIIQAFHDLVDREKTIPAWRCLLFSLWMFFCCYIYFVLIPSKTRYQTFFSSHLGMKAVTLDDSLNWRGKLTQGQLFRANFIPVLILPLLSALFFFGAWITNDNNWWSQLVQNQDNPITNFNARRSWIYGMRIIVAIVFFLQIHHLFTVGASKRALNWFTKSNRIIYVNVERALVIMSTEDSALPTEETLGERIIIPKEEEAELEAEAAQAENPQLEYYETINFAEEIEMDNDAFLEKIKLEEQGSLEEGEQEAK
ncbi:hypothetical protein [Candidatus Mycoplasma haematohominis]|uniref:hypothetical protein n=1 Tax=Candidatus Mycoplasma haematohominis TaxID=1494318 RepID=UPI001C0A73A8|nr:hypothetical protein [Candidatus Mycoplasma haemohominis]